MVKSDITSREDIELLVNTFYEKVKVNPVIGHIFTEVANVDWDAHLPVMYNFWTSAILGDQSYTGNPMTVHIALSKKTEMTMVHFIEWLKLFSETVDELFVGEMAKETKFRAGNIARLMLHKIETNQ